MKSFHCSYVWNNLIRRNVQLIHRWREIAPVIPHEIFRAVKVTFRRCKVPNCNYPFWINIRNATKLLLLHKSYLTATSYYSSSVWIPSFEVKPSDGTMSRTTTYETRLLLTNKIKIRIGNRVQNVPLKMIMSKHSKTKDGKIFELKKWKKMEMVEPRRWTRRIIAV